MIDFELLYTARKAILHDVVNLHVDALSYRSFITDFGHLFLYFFYKYLLESELGFLVIALSNKKVHGFVLGWFDSSKMLSILLKQFYIFFPILALKIIVQPHKIKNVLETLFYSKKERVEEKAELIVIAVEPEVRSTGVGKKLVEMLSEEFKRQGISSYKVTVHQEMERSNNFYLKSGFYLIDSFKMYNVIWNLYTMKLI